MLRACAQLPRALSKQLFSCSVLAGGAANEQLLPAYRAVQGALDISRDRHIIIPSGRSRGFASPSSEPARTPADRDGTLAPGPLGLYASRIAAGSVRADPKQVGRH